MDSKFIPIKAAVDELAAKLNVPENALPTYGYSKDFAYPHIEVDSRGQMHFVVVERGKEIERRSTTHIDELLYWIFEGITFSLASNFELKNRIEKQDSRRIMFAKHTELLAGLNPTWGQRVEQKYQEILQRHPFDDSAGLRANYFAELRAQGYPEDEIKRLAYQKYP